MVIKVMVMDSAQLLAGVDFSPLETVIHCYIRNFENKGVLS
jgi:hypothetical protein